MLLSHILDLNGIHSIVLERQTRQHVLDRIRAGALEAGTVDLLRAVGLGERMDREGHPHDGSAIAWEGRERFFIGTKKYTGKRMMAYGQTAITEDLYAARDAAGGQIIDEADNAQLHDLTSSRPHVHTRRMVKLIGWTAIMLLAATATTVSADIDPGVPAADL